MSKCGVFSGPYFPVFGLNTEIYGVNLRIQFEYRKIRTKKPPYLITFLAVNKYVIALTHITNTEIFALIAVLVFKLFKFYIHEQIIAKL